MVDSDTLLKAAEEENELEDMDMEHYPMPGDEEDFEEMNTCSSTDLGGLHTSVCCIEC